MIKNDFSFFKERYPELYENLTFAIENSVTDVDSCIFKVRKSLERLIAKICELEGIKTEKNLSANIENLYKNNLLDDIRFHQCNLIRNIGNLAVHDKTDDITLSRLVLNTFYDFCVWYAKKYDNTLNLKDAYNKNPDHNLKNLFVSGIDEKDKKFYDSMMSSFKEYIDHLIIRDKLGSDWGIVNDVEYVDFEEYSRYFTKALAHMANCSIPEAGIMPEQSLEHVLKFKEIARKRYGVSDEYKLNKLLAQSLYKNTYWYYK